MTEAAPAIRVGGPEDAGLLGRMLHEFSLEFGSSDPSAELAAELAGPQLASGEIAVLFPEEEVDGYPAGFAQLRFRLSLYEPGPGALLEELWVRPPARGTGLGRALLDASMDLARQHGATRIELNTSTDDVAARRLYESAGFTNIEKGTNGASMLYYERDL